MGKKIEKLACHKCLAVITYKKAKRVYRNNFGIPHYVLMCSKCADYEAKNRG